MTDYYITRMESLSFISISYLRWIPLSEYEYKKTYLYSICSFVAESGIYSEYPRMHRSGCVYGMMFTLFLKCYRIILSLDFCLFKILVYIESGYKVFHLLLPEIIRPEISCYNIVFSDFVLEVFYHFRFILLSKSKFMCFHEFYFSNKFLCYNSV